MNVKYGLTKQAGLFDWFSGKKKPTKKTTKKSINYDDDDVYYDPETGFSFNWRTGEFQDEYGHVIDMSGKLSEFAQDDNESYEYSKEMPMLANDDTLMDAIRERVAFTLNLDPNSFDNNTPFKKLGADDYDLVDIEDGISAELGLDYSDIPEKLYGKAKRVSDFEKWRPYMFKNKGLENVNGVRYSLKKSAGVRLSPGRMINGVKRYANYAINDFKSVAARRLPWGNKEAPKLTTDKADISDTLIPGLLSPEKIGSWLWMKRNKRRIMRNAARRVNNMTNPEVTNNLNAITRTGDINADRAALTQQLYTEGIGNSAMRKFPLLRTNKTSRMYSHKANENFPSDKPDDFLRRGIRAVNRFYLPGKVPLLAAASFGVGSGLLAEAGDEFAGPSNLIDPTDNFIFQYMRNNGWGGAVPVTKVALGPIQWTGEAAYAGARGAGQAFNGGVDLLRDAYGWTADKVSDAWNWGDRLVRNYLE